MEECNMAFQSSQADLDAALSVTCPPTMQPSASPSLWQAIEPMYSEEELTDPISNWMFNQMNNNAQIQTDFDLNNGNTLGVIGNQYVVVSEGRVYPTCVQHGGSGDAADPALVTVTGTTAGSAGEQRTALFAAATRNDYKHKDCPDLMDVCMPVSNYWVGEFTGRGLPEDIVDNLCYYAGSMMYVTKDAYKHICVGHGGAAEAVELCPLSNTDTYFCGGINGGQSVWGYPGQQTGAIDQALQNAMENGEFDVYYFTHPQCRGY